MKLHPFLLPVLIGQVLAMPVVADDFSLFGASFSFGSDIWNLPLVASQNGQGQLVYTFAPSPGASGGSRTHIFPGVASVTISGITADPDPAVTYHFSVTNDSDTVQVFSYENHVSLILDPGPTIVSSKLSGSVWDNSGEGAVGAFFGPGTSGVAVQRSFLDGINLGLDLGTQESVVTLDGDFSSFNYSVGPVNGPIGIFSTLSVVTQFELSPADTVSINGRTMITAGSLVPEPGSALLLTGGLAWCTLASRMRRRNPSAA